jgi:CheY-like chemotaxis protein
MLPCRHGKFWRLYSLFNNPFLALRFYLEVPLTDRIRLAVLDDLPLFRRGIKDALADTKFCVVAEGQPTEEACELVLKCKPDFVLADIDRPGDGLKLVKRVMTATAKFVAHFAPSRKGDVRKALRIGTGPRQASARSVASLPKRVTSKPFFSRFPERVSVP